MDVEQIIRQIQDTMRQFPTPPPDPFNFNPRQTFGGLRVVQTENLPRQQIGHWIEAKHAPRWFAVVLRVLGISPVVWIVTPMYNEGTVYRAGNTVFCSPWQYMTLRRDSRVVNFDCTT